MSIPQRNANPSVVVSASRTFFVTSSTWGKRSLFQSTRMAELFVKVLLEYRNQQKFRLHEFALVPDHFHVLFTIGPEMTVERTAQFIKGGFSFRAGRELNFHGAVWQRGFSEARVLDEGSFRYHVEYTRNNPVRAHLVDSPEHYPFCSAYPGYHLDPPPQGLKPSILKDAFCGTAESRALIRSCVASPLRAACVCRTLSALKRGALRAAEVRIRAWL